MSDLQKIKLGEIGAVVTGKTPSTMQGEFYESDDFMFIVPEDITDNPSDIEESKRYISRVGIESIKSNSIDGESIIVGCIGSDMGNVGFVRQKCATNQQINALTKIKPEYNAKYIFYVLSQMKDYLRIITGGSTTPILPKSLFEKIEIAVPNLDTQNMVANLLSSLDSKIKLNNKINSELEAIARALYDYWFVQFDFPDESGRPYKTSGGAMVFDNLLKREIPANWEVKRLKDLFEFEKGAETGSGAYCDNQERESFVSFYRVGDIDGSCKIFVDSSKYNLKIVTPTDVIVTFDGSVGKLGLGLSGAISGGLRHIYDKLGSIANATVWAIFSDPQIIADIEKYATGSVLKHASSAIDYLKMPYDEQIFLKFQETIEPIFAQLVANKQESEKLANLRDYLLPLLMDGQVSVKD